MPPERVAVAPMKVASTKKDESTTVKEEENDYETVPPIRFVIFVLFLSKSPKLFCLILILMIFSPHAKRDLLYGPLMPEESDDEFEEADFERDEKSDSLSALEPRVRSVLRESVVARVKERDENDRLSRELLARRLSSAIRKRFFFGCKTNDFLNTF